jgi:osmotically-inducible protein OsmY
MMRTLQLLGVGMALSVAVACNRSDVDPRAERAAEQMKAAAAKAGHQLADSWLTTKIQAQYFADDDIKARHINVSTRDAVVTLTGYVDSAPQRELAAQIARTTDGVREVHDRLTLTTGQPPERGAVATSGTDAAIPSAAPSDPAGAGMADDAIVTARVQSKFFVDPQVKGRNIEVTAQRGVIALKGEVGSEQERAQALLLARTTEGVARVEDHLVVAAPAPPAESGGSLRTDDASLTTSIQAKYFVDPIVKESAIEVTATNGVVSLAGEVSSEDARKQALAIASNTPGVGQVIDRMTVARPSR